MRDDDYNPSAEDALDRPQRGQILKSRSGRPVKAKKLSDLSETEDEEEKPSPARERARDRKRLSPAMTKSSGVGRTQPTKRQRWVPHNPHLLGKTEDDSSKDVQISDDDESAEDGQSRARRQIPGAPTATSVPLRDESGRFAGTRLQTEQERKQAAALGGSRGGASGGIFKNAAVQVLREELKLMSTGEIARMAMKRGYVKVQGRTPEATMASAMYTDVKRKEDRSLFIRPHEGLFGLREWIDEGTEYQDPMEDQPVKHAAQRSRMSNPASSQPTSRTSNRLAQKSRSIEHLEDYNSQATSERIESRLDQTARAAIACDAHIGDPTPFGDPRDGPSLDLFKPKVDLRGRNGLSNVRKRSFSGPLPPHLPSQHSSLAARRPARRSSATLSPENSGHMSLLLDAVDMDNRISGLLQKNASSQDRRPAVYHPQTIHPRTESAYNIFGNKPLPFQTALAGRMEVDGQPKTLLGDHPGLLNRLAGANMPHEEAFQQLEASFVSQPLQISHSLQGPLPAAIPPLNLSGTKDPDASAVSTTMALPLSNVNANSPSLAAPAGLRIPGSAFQVTGPPQMPPAAGAPNFGPPEEGIKRIPEVEAHVQSLETSLGMRHPRVGKGYLYLSRVYQLKATSAPEYYAKAQQALSHAYEICYAGQVTPKAPGSQI